jgi:hypothetical protein
MVGTLLEDGTRLILPMPTGDLGLPKTEIRGTRFPNTDRPSNQTTVL